jgi:single-strand DNA-binding protein
MSIMPLQLPEVTVVGTLTADPELRFIPSGKAVANFSIAANSRKKNQLTGEWEDGDATFLRCNIWGEYAEHVTESLTRGTKVIARGVLKQRSYEKDSVKHTVFELEVEEIGPTLRWATAKVSKATKGGGSGSSAPASNSGGFSDEPGWG